MTPTVSLCNHRCVFLAPSSLDVPPSLFLAASSARLQLTAQGASVAPVSRVYCTCTQITISTNTITTLHCHIVVSPSHMTSSLPHYHILSQLQLSPGQQQQQQLIFLAATISLIVTRTRAAVVAASTLLLLLCVVVEPAMEDMMAVLEFGS